MKILKQFKYWDVLEDLPEGWVIDKYCGSPLHGFDFCTNGKSILNGGKRALVRVKPKMKEAQIHTETPIETKPITEIHKEKEVVESADTLDFPAQKVNILARKKMINKLLNDIRVDLMVCEIEKWDKTEYINELQDVINSFKLDKK